MDEMGHADPGLALRVYRQMMRRGDEEKAALCALVEGSTVDVDQTAETVAAQSGGLGKSRPAARASTLMSA